MGLAYDRGQSKHLETEPSAHMQRHGKIFGRAMPRSRGVTDHGAARAIHLVQR
jgi:hypothetical protein